MSTVLCPKSEYDSGLKLLVNVNATNDRFVVFVSKAAAGDVVKIHFFFSKYTESYSEGLLNADLIPNYFYEFVCLLFFFVGVNRRPFYCHLASCCGLCSVAEPELDGAVAGRP